MTRLEYIKQNFIQLMKQNYQRAGYLDPVLVVVHNDQVAVTPIPAE